MPYASKWEQQERRSECIGKYMEGSGDGLVSHIIPIIVGET
jgi:hypothetical protein